LQCSQREVAAVTQQPPMSRRFVPREPVIVVDVEAALAAGNAQRSSLLRSLTRAPRSRGRRVPTPS
jgi:hypothetical protein